MEIHVTSWRRDGGGTQEESELESRFPTNTPHSSDPIHYTPHLPSSSSHLHLTTTIQASPVYSHSLLLHVAPSTCGAVSFPIHLLLSTRDLHRVSTPPTCCPPAGRAAMSSGIFHSLRSLSELPFPSGAQRLLDLRQRLMELESSGGEQSEEEGEGGAVSPSPPSYPLSSLLRCSPLPFAFLGFSSSGHFLFSYRRGSAVAGSRDEESVELFVQCWRCRPPQPLFLLLDVRVSEDTQEEELLYPPMVTMAESDDGRLLLVTVMGNLTTRAYASTIFALPDADSLTRVLAGRESIMSFVVQGISFHRCWLGPLLTSSSSSVSAVPSYVFLLQTEAAFHCLHFTCSPPNSGPPIYLSRSAPVTPLSPSPFPHGSLLHPQRCHRVFGSRSWAGWSDYEREDRADTGEQESDSSLEVQSEVSFDVETFLSQLPRVGEDGRMKNYAVHNLGSCERLEPLSASSTTSPCPFAAIIAVLQRYDDGGSSVHFILLYFDAITLVYSWRLLDRPPFRCSVKPSEMPIYKVLPLMECELKGEDEANAASLTTLCWPNCPPGLADSETHVLKRLTPGYDGSYDFTLEELSQFVARAFTLRTPTSSSARGPSAVRLHNFGVLRGRSLEQLRHPHNLFTLTLRRTLRPRIRQDAQPETGAAADIVNRSI